MTRPNIVLILMDDTSITCPGGCAIWKREPRHPISQRKPHQAQGPASGTAGPFAWKEGIYHRLCGGSSIYPSIRWVRSPANSGRPESCPTAGRRTVRDRPEHVSDRFYAHSSTLRTLRIGL
jgi:hypothetical protein